MNLVIALWSWVLVAYYGAAMRHLERTDPEHEDLPEIRRAYHESQAVVDEFLHPDSLETCAGCARLVDTDYEHDGDYLGVGLQYCCALCIERGAFFEFETEPQR